MGARGEARRRREEDKKESLVVKNKRGGKMKGRGKNCEEEREYKKGKEKKVIENGMREREKKRDDERI